MKITLENDKHFLSADLNEKLINQIITKNKCTRDFAVFLLRQRIHDFLLTRLKDLRGIE